MNTKHLNPTTINSSVMAVAKIIHKRGDQEQWGAEDESFDAAINLVLQVQKTGSEYFNHENSFIVYEELTALLQDELGLEPDYIENLWFPF